MSRFPVAFRRPAFASRVILLPLGNGASLTVGLPSAEFHLDPIGVFTFRMIKLRPGWMSSVPRERWCAPARLLPTGRHPPPYSGRSLSPAETSHLRK